MPDSSDCSASTRAAWPSSSAPASENSPLTVACGTGVGAGVGEAERRRPAFNRSRAKHFCEDEVEREVRGHSPFFPGSILKIMEETESAASRARAKRKKLEFESHQLASVWQRTISDRFSKQTTSTHYLYYLPNPILHFMIEP